MKAARDVPTRTQTKARTREAILDAAEELFLADGYHATTMVDIAASAGRTTGAVYGHFGTRETLCAEVVRRRLYRHGAQLISSVIAGPDDIDSRLETLANWWIVLSEDTAGLSLVAEYLMVALRNDAQRSDTAAHVDKGLDGGRVLLGELLSDGLNIDDADLGNAVDAAVATCVGLVAGQLLGLSTAHRSTILLSETIRSQLRRLSDPPVVQQ